MVSGRVETIGLILVSVLLNASAQICLRSAARAGFEVAHRGGPIEILLDAISRPGIIAGMAFYGLSLVSWVAVLARAEASLAYPFLAFGFVVVAVAGHFLLGEVLTVRRMIAIAVIVGGVILLSTS